MGFCVKNFIKQPMLALVTTTARLQQQEEDRVRIIIMPLIFV
jgi:hypothetical protein